MFSCFQESRASARLTAAWEDKHNNYGHSPSLLFFPELFCVDYDIIWHGICLPSVGASCPGCVPSQTLVHPGLLARRRGGRGRVGGKESLDAVQTMSSNSQNIYVLSAVF